MGLSKHADVFLIGNGSIYVGSWDNNLYAIRNTDSVKKMGIQNR